MQKTYSKVYDGAGRFPPGYVVPHGTPMRCPVCGWCSRLESIKSWFVTPGYHPMVDDRGAAGCWQSSPRAHHRAQGCGM